MAAVPQDSPLFKANALSAILATPAAPASAGLSFAGAKTAAPVSKMPVGVAVAPKQVAAPAAAPAQEETPVQNQQQPVGETMQNGAPFPVAPTVPTLPLQPQYVPRDLWESFGSPAMIVASLGSLMTKKPLTAGLNAAAAANNSIRAGDLAGYQRNVDLWKSNTDNALKLYDYQEKSYNDAINKNAQDVKAMAAEIRAVAAAGGDPTALAILDNQGVPAFMQYRSGVSQNMEQLRDASGKILPYTTEGRAALTGDDFLKTVPANDAPFVQAIAEGRHPGFTGMSARSPQAMRIMREVYQYKPDFDSTVYQKRQTSLKSFVGNGQNAQKLQAINTALNTMAQLKDASDRLGGIHGLGILNTPVNALRNATKSAESDPAIGNYNQLADNAANEVVKAIVANGGTGTEREIRAKYFSPNQTVAARAEAIQTAIKELVSRMEPIKDAYNNGMEQNNNAIDLLSPQARLSYARLMGVDPKDVRTGALDSDVYAAPVVAAPALSALSNEDLLAKLQGK